jgi:hypothetical protein
MKVIVLFLYGNRLSYSFVFRCKFKASEVVSEVDRRGCMRVKLPVRLLMAFHKRDTTDYLNYEVPLL